MLSLSATRQRRGTMNRKLIRAGTGATALVVAAAALLAAAPVQALLGPATRDTAHPAVGVLVPVFGKYCGATLVSPRVVLVAGHCVAGRRAAGIVRGTVTFDPDMTDGVQSATYDGDLLLDPAYKPNGSGDHDLGALVLDRAVTDVTPVGLPAPGWLDDLKAAGTLDAAAIDLVGYGSTTRAPGNSFTGAGVRLTSPNEYQSLTDSLLKTRAGDGQASSCDQDSGGAVFVDGTYAGVIVLGDASCSSWTGATRLDAPVEAAWVRSLISATAG